MASLVGVRSLCVPQALPFLHPSATRAIPLSTYAVLLAPRRHNSYHPSSSVPSFPSSSRRRLPLNTGIKFVPQQEAWIIERFGKFNRILSPGLAFLIPVIEQIRYVKSLKEIAIAVPSQSAITEDNVTLHIDGVLYYRIIDPYRASYGIEDAEYAIAQLAQTTMRAEIGRLTLDRTLAERARLNNNISEAINSASADWGIQCLRYEIRDIHPPERVVESMHMQSYAERQKRAQILESEGSRQAAINVAEGQKQSKILAAEAFQAEQINHARGEAEAILLKAQATAGAIREVANAIQQTGGHHAVALNVAEKYVEAFAHLAKESTTLVLPANAGDTANVVGQALSIYETITRRQRRSLNASGSSISELSDQDNVADNSANVFVDPAKPSN